jgi:hypothetical protein
MSVAARSLDARTGIVAQAPIVTGHLSPRADSYVFTRGWLALIGALWLSACGAGATTPQPGPANPAPAVVPPRVEEEPLSASARRCRTTRALECDTGEYCDFPVGGVCGETGRAGVCRPRPELCTREYMPVCGCDGRTWPTRCVAASQGVDAASDGPCRGDVGVTAPQPPTES